MANIFFVRPSASIDNGAVIVESIFHPIRQQKI